MKASGTSLFGLTVTGTVSGTNPKNTGVTLLEVRPSFDFGSVENLDRRVADGPSKYGINSDQNTLHVRTISDDEATALTTGHRLINFQGIMSNVDSFGDTTLNVLFQRNSEAETRSAYVYAETGYDLPSIDINWDARPDSQFLASDQIEDIRGEEGFLSLRLPSQQVEVRKRIVREELVEDDSLPEWKRSKVIERPRATIEVDPYLQVTLHRNLKIVETD